MGDFWGHFWAAVEALGAVAAIGWAIWLWRRDRTLANERRDAKARVLAFRLMPLLLDIALATDNSLKALNHIEKEAMNQPVPNVLLAIKNGVAMPPQPPENIFTDFDCLTPDLARALAHLFYAAERFNRYAKVIMEVAENAPSLLEKIYPTFRNRLKGINEDYAICGKLFFEQFGEVLDSSKLNFHFD